MDSGKLVNRIVIILVVAVLFYAGILFLGDFKQIIEGVSEINFDYFPAIFALLAFQIFLSGLKYQRLLQKLDIKIPFWESLKMFLGGYTMGITPGGGGTIIKSYFLKKNHSKSISSSVPVIIIEKASDFLSILVIMTILLIWVSFFEVQIILSIGYAVFILLLIILSNKNIFDLFKSLFSKIKITKKLTENFEESRSSIKLLMRSPSFVEALGYSILIKIAQLFVVYFIFLSVGIELDLFLSGQIYYASLLFGVLTFVPAGLIVTDTSMIGLLLKENIELPIATLGVLLVRLITTWIVFALGAIMLKSLLKEKSVSQN